MGRAPRVLVCLRLQEQAIEPGDEAGLDSALTTLVEDAALRERLGANGRKWAETFSWDQCAEAVYGDLL